GSGSEEHFEAFSDAGHDGGDLACGIDDLCLHVICGGSHLKVRAVDGLADKFDLVLCDEGGRPDDLAKLTHLIANELGRFGKVLGGGGKVSGHFGEMHGHFLALNAHRVDLFDERFDALLDPINSRDDSTNYKRNGDQSDRHNDETDGDNDRRHHHPELRIVRVHRLTFFSVADRIAGTALGNRL